MFLLLEIRPIKYCLHNFLIFVFSADVQCGEHLLGIQDHYLDCLQGFVEAGPKSGGHGLPSTRFGELLLLLPQLQSAAELLLNSKMFYVPFLLNSLNLPEEEAMDTTGAATAVSRQASAALSPVERGGESATSFPALMTWRQRQTSSREEIEAARDEVLRNIEIERQTGGVEGERLSGHSGLSASSTSHEADRSSREAELKTLNGEIKPETHPAPLSSDSTTTDKRSTPTFLKPLPVSSSTAPVLSQAHFPEPGNKLRQLLEAPKE